MSEENKSRSEPAPSSDGSEFIRDLHRRTKRGNTTAIVVSIALALFVMIYMHVISGWLERDLTKKSISDYLITETAEWIGDKQNQEDIKAFVVSEVENQMDANTPRLKTEVETQLPTLIQKKVPEYIASSVPGIRKNFQTQADHYFIRALDDVKPQLTKAIDEVFSEYKTEIDEYQKKIGDAKNLGAEEQKRLETEAEDLIGKLADTLVERLLEVATRRKFDNPKVDQAYRDSLLRLKNVNKDLVSLAAPNEELNQEDRDLRYSVALMLDRLEWSTPTHVRKPTKKEEVAPAPKKK